MDSIEQKAAKKLERQEKKKRIRQEQLIDTAEAIFLENSYDNTTLEMIADEAGYTKRTLYLYFRDKDDIFSAVVLRALSTLYEKLKTASESRSKGADRLLALAGAYYEYFLEYPEYFEFNRIFEARLYYYHRPALQDDMGEFAVHCQKVNDDISDLLIEVIETGINDGTIHSHTSSLNLMLILWGATFGILQVLCMRRSHLRDVYKTTEDKLFSDYIQLIKNIIT